MFYDASDAQFLMSIPIEDNNDYNVDLKGRATHGINTDPNTGVQHLVVTFEDSDGTRLEGEWRLSLVSLTKSGGPESEEVVPG